MDGIVFYWVMWGIWVWTTFIMGYRPLRFWASFACLIAIIFSGAFIHVNMIKINAAYILFFAVGLGLLRRSSYLKLGYYIIVHLFVMMLYIVYTKYTLYEPAILLKINQWLFFAAIFLVVQLLVKPFKIRLAVIIIGFCQAEWVMSIVLSPKDFIIGDYPFLDRLAFLTFLTISWHFIHRISHQLYQTLNRSSIGRIEK
ncbi:hypothetical protein JOD45_001520 [Scopulibacillus daqui]|uniref:Membrane protein YpjA n=1 Tax=Scopulibacillus daqui TaxID=1469162 RepID=A0ABS2PZ38_9BACL|nr:hypothetical protein [Scopulibacillus daqui]MBM7645309.1 hypothetical protein [Scopulibacillus daqui]